MEQKKCKYDLAWVSRGCQEPAVERGYCEKHSKEKCWKGKHQATGQCSSDAGSFICGMPECKAHRHPHTYP